MDNVVIGGGGGGRCADDTGTDNGVLSGVTNNLLEYGLG